MYVWSEFHTAKVSRNPAQVKIDLSKPTTLWFYLGKTSTEAKAQYTGDLAKQFNDLAANFLESVKPAAPAVPPAVRKSYPASYPTISGPNVNALNAARANMLIHQQARPQQQQVRPPQKTQDRPYTGKYAIKDPLPFTPNNGFHVDHQALRNQRAFLQSASAYPTPQFIRPESYQAPPAQMRAIAPPLPTMADVQRRQSNPQNTVEDYRRVSCALLHIWSYANALQYAQANHPSFQQQPMLQPQPQAPVANMMGSGTPTGRNPFSRPSSAQQLLHTLNDPTTQNRSRSASIVALAKYPYLHDAALKRPRVYVSPYAPGGGFTEAWLPNPTAPKPKHSRQISLSQEFLMKRTPSEKEQVKSHTHVRQVSADKAILQKQHQEQMQKRQQELKQQTQMPPPIPLSLETHQTMPPHLVHTQPFQYPIYPRPQTYSDYQNPFPPPSHAYPDLLHQDHTPFPSTHSYQPPGLQFQSPRDFQLQMQRETQHGKEAGSYEAFLREMQEVGNLHSHPHRHNSGDSGGGGDSGSPLRQGMRAAGGEMLPMMRDQY